MVTHWTTIHLVPQLTALARAELHAALHSADSLAWSYAARKQGRNPNDWREAQCFLDQIIA